MLTFIAWYLTVSILGWLAFPLAYRLFPALADRGYSLARALGLLVWGYAFWLMASLGIAQNDLGGLLLALTVLIGISAWSLRRTTKDERAKTQDKHPSFVIGLSSVGEWLKSNLRSVVPVELLFLLAFAAWTFVRASNPEITTAGGEKTMELAFINAILRSPTFPPHDPWLSGYAISYYYFGYVMTAMLAKMTAVPGSVAFNLMIALLFALSAIGAYGILYNLLEAWQKASDNRRPALRLRSGQAMDDRQLTMNDCPRSSVIGFSFLGPLFLLIVSNLEGFLEVLHRRGLFWPPNAQPATRNFWQWLDIIELRDPPSQPLGWIPDRFIWWWRASRVVQDYDLAGNWREVIDEFPFFSYLLGDLHPHVLAMPFCLLVVAVALNLFLGGWRGETNLGLYRLPISRAGFLFMALALGGLAFLNTWDILVGFALVIGAYVLARARETGWAWERLEDLFKLGLPLGLLALVLYLPFYAGFSSQAGGILPNLDTPTRGAHLWVMFGTLLLPLFAYLIYLRRREGRPANWGLGIGLVLGLTFLLFLLSWLLGLAIYLRAPEFANSYLTAQGTSNLLDLFRLASLRRLDYLGGLLTLLLVLGVALALLSRIGNRQSSIPDPQSPILNPQSFVLLLVALAALLVLVPEFVYLRDQFGSRMNTIFKFYYQAWLLWSLAAAFGVAVMLQKLRRGWLWAYSAGLTVVLLVALAYPTLGLFNKTNNFQPPFGWTLDGAAHLHRHYPDDAAAIRWLQSAPDGIVAEAVGGSYSDYGRVSTYSGLPTVLGWHGHESQWRGGYEEQGSRLDDIKILYETDDWYLAQTILQRYGIRYVYIGTLERYTYEVVESKFQRFLQPVFIQGNVVIYVTP